MNRLSLPQQRVVGTLSIISTILFASCDKSDEVQQAAPKNNDNVEYSISISNMETEIGQKHNDAMDYIAEHADFSSLTIDGLIDILEQFDINNGGSAYTSEQKDTYKQDILDIDFSVDLYKLVDQLLSKGSISTAVHDQFDRIADEAYDETQTLANLKSDLIAIERDINSMSTFTNAEKEMLIGTSVIARYSIEYWTQVEADPDTKWPDVDYGIFKKAWEDIKGFFRGLDDPYTASAWDKGVASSRNASGAVGAALRTP